MNSNKIIQDLLRHLGLDPTTSPASNAIVWNITSDSRKVGPGSVFFALPGFKDDGVRYLAEAREKGAILVLQQSDLREPIREAYARAASWFYNHPEKELQCIGITGTSGKTTTTTLLAHILNSAGIATGLIGTVEHKFKYLRIPASHTTPDPIEIFYYLREFLDMGATHVVMEVSSHALEQARVFGIDFAYAGFLNLSPEHLDYHGDMETYYQAKKKLFSNRVASAPSQNFILTESEWGRRLCTEVNGIAIQNSISDFSCTPRGCTGSLQLGSSFPFDCALGGSFQRQNIELASAIAFSILQDSSKVLSGLATFPGVPGRMERVDGARKNAPTVFVDYAHKPEALEKVLISARDACRGRLIVVFGCGGDRDRTKRPKMGDIASRLADLVFVTSDNSRSEKPENIMQEILGGILAADRPKVTLESDRARAIASAIRAAGAGDVVIIAGKGHEKYQIFSDRTVPFDDVDVARGVLNSL